MGERLNQLRRALEQELDARLDAVNRQAKSKALAEERIDITLPGTRLERGHIHPLTLVIDEIVDIFSGMGFEIARGPDIEDDYHNFEALNIPKDHPARDMQDTFFVAGGNLLRTHTSPVQIRTMETPQTAVADCRSRRSLSPRRRCHPFADVSSGRRFHGRSGTSPSPI